MELADSQEQSPASGNMVEGLRKLRKELLQSPLYQGIGLEGGVEEELKNLQELYSQAMYGRLGDDYIKSIKWQMSPEGRRLKEGIKGHMTAAEASVFGALLINAPSLGFLLENMPAKTSHRELAMPYGCRAFGMLLATYYSSIDSLALSKAVDDTFTEWKYDFSPLEPPSAKPESSCNAFSKLYIESLPFDQGIIAFTMIELNKTGREQQYLAGNGAANSQPGYALPKGLQIPDEFAYFLPEALKCQQGMNPQEKKQFLLDVFDAAAEKSMVKLPLVSPQDLDHAAGLNHKTGPNKAFSEAVFPVLGTLNGAMERKRAREARLRHYF